MPARFFPRANIIYPFFPQLGPQLFLTTQYFFSWPSEPYKTEHMQDIESTGVADHRSLAYLFFSPPDDGDGVICILPSVESPQIVLACPGVLGWTGIEHSV
eukprot:GHVU01138205.1.p1 GENE.GHVU01138205.1~~GHVU01138205.1.p1  ORF type:complete len:101 (+),score=2.12 GHVU01138205.1:375-677(+)